MSTAMPFPTPDDTAETYWNGFYRGLDRPAASPPGPNALLVEEVGPLSPGTALDLGCGFGGDAIWLATQGWRVTAVDVSGAVLERAGEYAARADVAERIDWQRHDLTATFPAGTHDLVCAQFLHSPMERPGQRDAILRRALDAVAPGGSLLVTGHTGIPDSMKGTPFDVHLPTTTELHAALNPDPAVWSTVTERAATRETTGPDGRSFTHRDMMLRLVRAQAYAR
ncbi:class I SAM-dependent methyltransferase [Pseudonocardia xinjiangensis]|uniref:class I SAM-dependent methyltransferase n=1 Tax=Pseudonocardia xinjiangensis TaxID=75289 RepID=UPI003D94C971